MKLKCKYCHRLFKQFFIFHLSIFILLSSLFAIFPFSLFSQSSKTELPGNTLFQHGTTSLLNGDLSTAEEYYEQAIPLIAEDTLLTVQLFSNLGAIAFLGEDYVMATERYQHALLLLYPVAERYPSLAGQILCDFGAVCAYSGNEEKALEYYRGAKNIFAGIEPAEGPWDARMNVSLGTIYLHKKIPDSAASCFRNAISVYGALHPDDPESALALEGMAGVKMLGKEYDSALFFIRAAAAEFRNADPTRFPELANAYYEAGRISDAAGHSNDAIANYDTARSFILFQDGDRYPGFTCTSRLVELFRIYSAKADAWNKLYISDPLKGSCQEKAFDNYLQALGILETIDNEFGSGTSALFFNEEAKNTIGKALETGYSLSRNNNSVPVSLLFSVSEADRDRMLYSSMTRARRLSTGGTTDSLWKAEKQLKKEIIASSRKLVSDEYYSFNRLYYESLIKNLGQKEQGYFLMRKIDSSGMTPLSPVDIRIDPLSKKVKEKLRANEAMLEYCFSDSSIFLFAVTRDTISCFKLPGGEMMRKKIRTFSSSLKNAEPDVSSQLGKELFNDLILPALDLLHGKTHLIIIPDEELSLIPFEALINEKPDSPAAIVYPIPYLLLNYEISYHFSASLWCEMSAASQDNPLSFCGFAPVNFDPALNVPSLPESSEEIISIAGKFRQKGFRSDVFLASKANETNFEAAQSSYDCMHLASHSMIDYTRPANSGILFSDDTLYLDEIENLPAGCRLLVLSSCATGMGMLTRSEGMLALSRAFMMSGSQNIIWSLWNVRDSYTKKFMIDFYSGYLSGMSIPAALRSAKLNMIMKPETTLPIIWAGFVVTGE